MIRTWHANFCLQSVFVFALIKICIFTWQLALFIVDSRILNYFMQLIVCWVHHYCFSSMAINLIGYEYVLAHRVMYRIMKRSNTITPLLSLSLSHQPFFGHLWQAWEGNLNPTIGLTKVSPTSNHLWL